MYTTVMASSNAVSDPAGARRLGNASIGLSIAGIIVTVVIIIVVVAVSVSSVSCTYTYVGSCWRHRSYVGSYGYCPGYRSSSGYCYYD